MLLHWHHHEIKKTHEFMKSVIGFGLFDTCFKKMCFSFFCFLFFFNRDLCQLKTVIGFSHLHPRRHTIHTYSFTADGAQLIVQCEGGGVYLALQEKYCGTKTTVWNIWILIYLQINNYWYEACLWGRTTQHKSILAFFFFFKDTVVKKSQDQAVVLTCKLWRTEGEIFFWSFS